MSSSLRTVRFSSTLYICLYRRIKADLNSDGTYHPLGALLFSNQTYTETLKIINPSGVKSVPFNPGALWLYDYMTGASVQQAAPSAAFVTLLISELQRYALLWQTFAPYSGVGYKVYCNPPWFL